MAQAQSFDNSEAVVIIGAGLCRASQARMSLSVIQRSVNRETTNASRLLDARTPKPGFDQERKSGTRLTDVNSDLSDEELVLLARSGNRDAFAKLTCRHFSSCLKRALLILHNRCDAEDEVQNAFTRAFQCLEQFRSEGPFSAWLFRIVQNQCLMLMREQRQADLVYVDVTSDSKLRLELVDQMPDQEEHMGAQEVMSLLRREISHVPPLMRNVLRLRDIEGLPMPEVAARLGLSIPAAKSRLMRARKELRERLTKYCGRSGPRTLIERPVPEKAQYTYIS